VLSAFDIELLRSKLLAWYDLHRRDLPWRRTKDPYAILVSEVMLQQTRVAAAVSYFEAFMRRFPGVRELAEAAEEEVLAVWAGLGYYYRARNLQRAARTILERGSFPKDSESLRELPGVGVYTAAAVASIGFSEPTGAIDGNAIRVLSRIFDDPTPANSSAGRARWDVLAEAMLDTCRPGDFNQAVMELGATLCAPVNPQCLVCPVSELCRARQNGTQNERPVKKAPSKPIQEHRIVFWIQQNDRVLAWQRSEQERLMPGFWELPEREQLPEAQAGELLGKFAHSITVHKYRFEIRLVQAPHDLGVCHWLTLDDLDRVAVSTVFRKAKRVVERLGPGTFAARAAST
jgi:A/G-specific adenine glycosylase